VRAEAEETVGSQNIKVKMGTRITVLWFVRH